MIKLSLIAEQYQQQFLDKYSDKLKPVHRRALQQIIACHTPRAGAMLYHCDHCHPSFAKGIIDPGSYAIEPYRDIKVLHHSSKPSQSDEAWYDVSGADYGSFFLWPATSIQFYPGGVVNSFTWRPLAVDDVRVFRSFYSDDGEVDETLHKVIENDRATTFQEDLDIVKEVQRGINSRGYKPGPLVLNPEGGINNERPIQKLHEWLRAAVD